MSIHDFDPNKPLDDGKTPVYGVYKGGKTMKTFTNRGHALSSFAHGHEAKLFQMVSGRWVEVAYRPSHRPAHQAHSAFDICTCNICACDICGSPTERQRGGPSGWISETGRWCWDKLGGKVVEPLKLLWACGECRAARGL